MKKDEFLKMKYDEVFYNTIGLIDSVVIKMVKDLIELGDDYKCNDIFRNNDCYNDSKLILRFDNYLNNNSLFVDIRLNYDNYCGMMEGNIRNSIIVSSKIFDNINDVRPEDYKYIRIDFCMIYGNELSKRILFCSDDGSLKFDGWQIYYWNSTEAYNRYLKIKDTSMVDNKVRWLVMLECDNFMDLDGVIGDDLVSMKDKEILYNNIKKVSLNADILSRVDEINCKCSKYNYIYYTGMEKGKVQLKEEFVGRMKQRGISNDLIIEVLNLSAIELERLKNSDKNW